MLEFIFGKPNYPKYCNYCGAEVVDIILYTDYIRYSTETGDPYVKVAPYKVCKETWDSKPDKVRKAVVEYDSYYYISLHYLKKTGKGYTKLL